MKKILSIILSILMVVTMLPIAIMPASAAYDYDETTKLSFKITNLVREWKGETKELGESGSGFYEQSLTKVAENISTPIEQHFLPVAVLGGVTPKLLPSME